MFERLVWLEVVEDGLEEKSGDDHERGERANGVEAFGAEFLVDEDGEGLGEIGDDEDRAEFGGGAREREGRSAKEATAD